MTGPAYLEYGGLASVPGPFACAEATIYLFALEADHDRLDALCRTVLVDPDGTRSYTALGRHVLLSFGTMTVRSLSPATSTYFGAAYADMGGSVERHAALWVPTVAGHRAGRVDHIEQLAMFIPAMWVDNPVSLLGGRDIYGIAKEWGLPAVADGDAPSCVLDVFGGDFGPGARTGSHRLLELSPVHGSRPLAAAEEVALGAGEVAGEALGELLHGRIAVPDRALFREAVAAVARHELRQVAVRQLRTPVGDGAVATDVELVELATRLDDGARARLLHHPFEFLLHPLDSHPVGRSLGLASQRVDLGLEVTGGFVLGVA